ncbi:MAG: Fpg/Nei family DNA glycosylase [Promethearchaeota archaeon]
MPELPEVEAYRIFFEKNGLNQEILTVSIPDATVLRNIDPEIFIRSLNGLHFNSTHRHGKYLFATLSSDQVVMFHFGMTGDLHTGETASELHPHDRIIFEFFSHRYLAYSSQRKFGRVELWPSIEACLTKRKLGRDALEIKMEEFFEGISPSSRPIKSLLLDQKKVAGIGNLYADEALFQSRIHPLTMGSQLSSSQSLLLFQKFQKILHIAIENNANFGQFPLEFLIHTRNPKGKCPRCGTLLKHLKIGQRTTFFCPKCQIKN